LKYDLTICVQPLVVKRDINIKDQLLLKQLE